MQASLKKYLYASVSQSLEYFPTKFPSPLFHLKRSLKKQEYETVLQVRRHLSVAGS